MNMKDTHDERSDVDRAQDDSADSVSCKRCGGPATLLGELGNLAHFRCIDCGGDFHIEVTL